MDANKVCYRDYQCGDIRVVESVGGRCVHGGCSGVGGGVLV